jgi:hypothetical protein
MFCGTDLAPREGSAQSGVGSTLGGVGRESQQSLEAMILVDIGDRGGRAGLDWPSHGFARLRQARLWHECAAHWLAKDAWCRRKRPTHQSVSP